MHCGSAAVSDADPDAAARESRRKPHPRRRQRTDLEHREAEDTAVSAPEVTPTAGDPTGQVSELDEGNL